MTRTTRHAHRANERHPVRDALTLLAGAVALLGLFLIVGATLYVASWASS